jgi:ferrochelatase
MTIIDMVRDYDAILVLSFGGPEGMDDVLPFLENVTAGRAIPRERLLAVAQHYYARNGISPINAQNRALIVALELELRQRNIHIPVYFGNRNWHPFLRDTIQTMQADGKKQVLTFVTSAYSSYSGCRQYREDIIRASQDLVEPPQFAKIRVFYNHPKYIDAICAQITPAVATWPLTSTDYLLFTAHSIPMAMAEKSAYITQLTETCRLVAHTLGISQYQLVFQSRSGAPQTPWLEPDVNEVITQLHQQGIEHTIVVPVGFISDHMEVVHDLDTEAHATATQLGMQFTRVASVGTHPVFISMITDLIAERCTSGTNRQACGHFPANHDICPLDCCLPR